MEHLFVNVVAPFIVGLSLLLISHWLDQRKEKDD